MHFIVRTPSGYIVLQVIKEYGIMGWLGKGIICIGKSVVLKFRYYSSVNFWCKNMSDGAWIKNIRNMKHGLKMSISCLWCIMCVLKCGAQRDSQVTIFFLLALYLIILIFLNSDIKQ